MSKQEDNHQIFPDKRKLDLATNLNTCGMESGGKGPAGGEGKT